MALLRDFLVRAGSRRLLRAWAGSTTGASAIEFALLAPILALSFLATVDLGLGLGERMTMDHVLRSGAQVALQDPGASTVTSVMQAAAEANFTIAGSVDPAPADALTVSTVKFCACPNSTGVAVDCTTICTGTVPTFVYYRMQAQTSYAGRILPTIDLDQTIQVQIR